MSRHPFRNLIFFVAGWVALGLIAGCGGSGPPRVTVGGKVTLDDQPVTQGFVVFFPDKDNPNRFIPRGKIDSAGNYQLITNEKSGAPAGWYKAVLEIEAPKAKLGAPPPPAPVPEIYMSINDSPLSIQVVAESKTYDLKLSKKAQKAEKPPEKEPGK